VPSSADAGLSTIVDIAADAVISIDQHHRIIRFNQGAEEIFGRARVDTLGRPLDLLLPSGAVDLHSHHVDRFGRGEVPARRMGERTEVRGRRADGSEFPAEASISKATVENEQIFTVILRDVSEQRRVEQILRATEASRQAGGIQAHLAAIVESSDDAIIGTLPDGTITSWNTGAQRVCDYRSEEIIGESIALLVAPERPAEASELLGLIAAGRSVVHYETVGTKKGGTPVDLSLTISPIRGPDETIVGAAAIGRDITERKRAEAELVHRALHDTLTELPNRALLADRLDQALTRCARDGGEVAVLFLDLDRFKVVNDGRSHAAGDQVLRAVGERLRDAVRPADTVARVGGDEFVIVCEKAGRREGSLLARRIEAHLEVPFDVDVTPVVLTASIGLAVGRVGDSAKSLIRDADAAMYEAKAKGGSRTELFHTELHTRTERRLSMEAALRLAVPRDELWVAYQPIVSLSDEAMVGAEALLRWDSPDPAWAMPDAFIPVAEATGLIGPIGAWVLERVGRQLLEWSGTFTSAVPGFNVSVNVSPLQLTPALFDSLVGLVRDGLDPRQISLELTENVLMGDAEQSIEALLGLRAVGVNLTMDDFGTGYSSLSYLRRFPIDTLKIDRSFIDGLGRDGHGSAIVRAIIAMARSLGLSVVAEGVETAEQLAVLKELGCEFAQGFYWSPAVPAAELLSAFGAPHQGDVDVEETGRFDAP
jgi:diguanylate cyclase (GGDEF)-like protein/PAS domain S-box-containing protein